VIIIPYPIAKKPIAKNREKRAGGEKFFLMFISLFYDYFWDYM
jgi:hypothetical protein